MTDTDGTVRVRRARPGDAEALLRLLKAAYSVEGDPHRSPDLVFPDTLEDVRGRLEDELVLVAEDADGRLVGTVSVRSVASVRRFGVDPAHQRCGIGDALLAAAEDAAREKGLTEAWLDTVPDHPWINAYYARRGYVDRGRVTRPSGTEWKAFRKALATDRQD